MLIFEIRLPLKERLVATSDKTRALTSRISAVSQVMKIPKSAKKKKIPWLHSSVFVLE